MNPTNGIQRKSAYVGWTTASTSDAAVAEASIDQAGCRVASTASASAAGTRSCRDPVAGSASAVSAPPCPGAIATTATPAAADAAAGTACRNSAQPASNATTTAIGASTVGPWTTTSTGSAPETFATSARKPCQSGNAYPGWRPPSGNSFAASSERSSKARSFWTRARWKNPSPPTWPGDAPEQKHRGATPAPGAGQRHGTDGSLRPLRRSPAGRATTPAPSKSDGVKHRAKKPRSERQGQPRRRPASATTRPRPTRDARRAHAPRQPREQARRRTPKTSWRAARRPFSAHSAASSASTPPEPSHRAASRYMRPLPRGGSSRARGAMREASVVPARPHRAGRGATGTGGFPERSHGRGGRRATRRRRGRSAHRG